jgi:hypothetical protein
MSIGPLRRSMGVPPMIPHRSMGVPPMIPHRGMGVPPMTSHLLPFPS